MNVSPRSLLPDDEVLLTGQASSPVRHFVRLAGVIATRSERPGEPLWFKVWADEADGKIWFRADDITEAWLVSREAEDDPSAR